MKKVTLVSSKVLLVLAVMFFCALPMSASAANLYVGGSACDYSTIQSAINAASNGDNIYVHEGTYVEQIDYLGKSIVVKSLLGAAVTTIDANGGAITVTMSVSEGSEATLDGFTVTGAVSQGIYSTCGNLQSTSLIIKNCIVTENYQGISLIGNYYANNSVSIEDSLITYNNSGNSSGTGMYISTYNTINITNCEISNNASSSFGAGAYIYSSSNILFANCNIQNNSVSSSLSGDTAGVMLSLCTDAIFNSCIIQDNSVSTTSYLNGKGAGLSLFRLAGEVQINNCMITDNSITAPEARGAGIYVYSISSGSTVEINIDSSTIASNYCSPSTWSYEDKEGGIRMEGTGSKITLNLKNSILWGNTPGEIGGKQINSLFGATVNVTYTDIQAGWTGTGNIDDDPLFVSSSDYHLQSSSPCINVGDTTLDVDFEATSRPRGSADDMGADEY